MDYKEKYEKAIEKAKKYYNRELYSECNGSLVEDIFPELKESEDERIRKNLIDFLKSPFVSENITNEKVAPWIAWLGKQGKREHIVVIPKFRVGDVIRPKGSMAEYTIESISGEYYYGKGWTLHISCDDYYEIVKQNPAWSEEDEKGLGDALWAIEQAKTIAKDENDMGNLWYAENWLKSLKERMKGK